MSLRGFADPKLAKHSQSSKALCPSKAIAYIPLYTHQERLLYPIGYPLYSQIWQHHNNHSIYNHIYIDIRIYPTIYPRVNQHRCGQPMVSHFGKSSPNGSHGLKAFSPCSLPETRNHSVSVRSESPSGESHAPPTTMALQKGGFMDPQELDGYGQIPFFHG